MQRTKMEPLQTKALASQDQAWTDIAKRKDQLEAILKRGFRESDVHAVKESLQLVLAEIAFREAEMLTQPHECELVIGDEYQINFMDPEQDASTWFDGTAVFMEVDGDDYGTGEPHGLFRLEDEDEEEVISFPLSSVGERLK